MFDRKATGTEHPVNTNFMNGKNVEGNMFSTKRIDKSTVNTRKIGKRQLFKIFQWWKKRC